MAIPALTVLVRRCRPSPRVIVPLAAVSAAFITACGTPHRQAESKLFQVGVLGFGDPTTLPWIPASEQQALGSLGYVEGKNVHIEWRWAEGDPGRLPALAAELVALKPDVLVGASDPSAAALQAATSKIPIVFAACGDPVRQGFVASLAHPGGNLTGTTVTCAGSLPDEKRIELLRALLPGASRLAVLWYPATSDVDAELSDVDAAARKLDFALQRLEVQAPEDLVGAVAAAAASQADALLALPSSFMISNRAAVVNLARQYHLPAAYGYSQFTEAGGLIAYGPNLLDDYRRTWAYVDRIHKGANPALTPVEQPTTFELVVNVKEAELLGITVPEAVLAKATDVLR